MSSTTNEAMGHIIMWKGKRVSHTEYENEMGGHVAPSVDLSKNFKYVLNRSMSEWKSNTYGITRFRPMLTPMWRSWDREDNRRDKYEVGYNYQNDDGDTEYVFTCCVQLVKYDELHPGYAKDPEINFYSSKEGNAQPIKDPKDAAGYIPTVNYMVKKYWDKYASRPATGPNGEIVVMPQKTHEQDYGGRVNYFKIAHEGDRDEDGNMYAKLVT